MNAERKHQRELCAKAKAGDKVASNELVRLSLGYVHSVARTVSQRSPGCQVDDLVSEGCLGVVHAIRKFDPEQKTTFLSYAAQWIWQYINKAVKAQRAFLNGTRNLYQRYQSVPKQLRRLLNEGVDRTVAVAYLAQKHCVSIATLEEALSGLNVRLVYVDGIGPANGRDLNGVSWHESFPSNDVPADEVLMTAERAKAVRDVVAGMSMSDRERAIVEGRHLSEDPMGLRPMGALLGVTAERVRQIEIKVLIRLRAELAKHPLFFRPADSASLARPVRFRKPKEALAA